MKLDHLVVIGLLATAAASQAANSENVPQEQLSHNYPKNLARQHLGANLLVFNPANQAYVPTEAAAAWLDDDVATGWPAMAGKQHYLVALPQPELIHNFCLSTRSGAGTVSIYAGDEPATPTSKSWTALAKDVPVESLNQKLGKSFGRFAKYVLIETNLTEAAPWYSLYLYGEKSASTYHVQKRVQPVDARTIFGPYVNPQTAFSLSSLYAHGRVAYANASDTATAWSRMIDDNPNTAVTIAPSTKEGGLVIRYDNAYAIQRISVLTDAAAKGRLDFFLLGGAASTAPQSAETVDGTKSDFIKVSNAATGVPSNVPVATAPDQPVSIANMTPVATISFDGSTSRGSADFTPASGSILVARWTPETEGQRLALNEVNSFSDVSPSNYEAAAADSIAEDLQVDNSKGSGKEMLNPVGEGKETLPPAVGESLPLKTPFIPGLAPFPPNIPFSPR